MLAKKKKVRSKRTNNHSESEISTLNSTVQYDATDFGEPLAEDTSALSTILPHVDQENVSFDISYDYVPLQSNEPEVNEENETSKKSSVPTSAVKTDKSTQGKYDKYALCAKIENIIVRNEIKTLKSSQNKDISNPMPHEAVLASPGKSKYFISLSPTQFWALYDFLGPAKFNLTYWNESKGYGKKLNHSISFQIFITVLRLRRGFNILTIAHWYMVLVNIQSELYLLPGLCFFLITLRTTDISCFPNDKNSKILYQTYFVLLKIFVLQLTVQSLNVKCHETTANREIFAHHIKVIVQ